MLPCRSYTLVQYKNVQKRLLTARSVRPTVAARNGRYRNVATMNTLLRLTQVLAVIPVSCATWYAGNAGNKSGRYPRPISLGPSCVGRGLRDIQRIVTAGAAAVGGVQ